MTDKNPFKTSAQSGFATEKSVFSAEDDAAGYAKHQNNSAPIPGPADGKTKSSQVGGLFSYLLSRKKQSTHTTNDKCLSHVNVEDINAGNQNDSRRMSSRGKYHKFANAVGSYNFGSYEFSDDSDTDDENEPLFGAVRNRYSRMNSSTNMDESKQLSPSWMTHFGQMGKSVIDSATEWFHGSTYEQSGKKNEQEQNNKNSFEMRWVTPAFNLPTYVSSTLSSNITTISSYNPFSGDQATHETGNGAVENNPSGGTDNSSNPALLSKLASRSDVLWATKTRNPYQGVIGRDVDYLLSRDEDNMFSLYLNPFRLIGISSYDDGDLLLQDGDDLPKSSIHGAVRLQDRGFLGISVSEKGSEHVNQRSPKLATWRQSQDNVRKRNTPSDASVQAVKNLLSLVQRQVVVPMMIQSKIRENTKQRSTSSFSSTTSSCDEPDAPDREKLRIQIAESPMLPLLNSSPKMSPPDPFPEFPDFGTSPELKKPEYKHGRSSVLENPSYDDCSSSVQSPRSSPARILNATNESPSQQRQTVPLVDNAKQTEKEVLFSRQVSMSSNSNEGRNPNSALHAEMAARLSEGTLRAFRDLALDEATELHSALHFWTIRWERPILGWLEAGPIVWFSDEGYSPYDAGKKVSQIQAVLARR